MTLERSVVADFEMAQAQFGLLLLETRLDPGAGKADGEQGFDGRVGGGVGKEVLLFGRFEDVLSDDQMSQERTLVAAEIEEEVFDLPDHGALVGVFDVVGGPRQRLE